MVVERLKALDRDTLKAATDKYLSSFEIDALLKRRDAIVKRLEMFGPVALFDRIVWAVPPAVLTCRRQKTGGRRQNRSVLTIALTPDS